jgi:hypothetical protein
MFFDEYFPINARISAISPTAIQTAMGNMDVLIIIRLIRTLKMRRAPLFGTFVTYRKNIGPPMIAVTQGPINSVMGLKLITVIMTTINTMKMAAKAPAKI